MEPLDEYWVESDMTYIEQYDRIVSNFQKEFHGDYFYRTFTSRSYKWWLIANYMKALNTLNEEYSVDR